MKRRVKIKRSYSNIGEYIRNTHFPVHKNMLEKMARHYRDCHDVYVGKKILKNLNIYVKHRQHINGLIWTVVVLTKGQPFTCGLGYTIYTKLHRTVRAASRTITFLRKRFPGTKIIDINKLG